MNKYCLVTTSNRECVDINTKLLFLSQGAKESFSDEELKKLDFEDLDFIWNNTKSVKEGIAFCSDFYSQVLKIVTEELNIIHQTHYETHYYHLVLGNWLQHYIHVLYDKYISLNCAKEKYKNIETVIPSNQSYVPQDYNDFVSKCFSSDEYNLQLYSEIIKICNIKYTEKELLEPLNTLREYKKDINPKRRILNKLNKIFLMVNKIFHKEYLMLTDIYLKYNMFQNMFKIFFKGKIKYLFNDLAFEYKFESKIDKNLRNRKILALNKTEFETIFSQLFYKDIPWLFLEGYQDFKSYVLKLPIKKPKVIFSANGIHGNYILKFYLAEYYKDIKFLYIMHGGYGFEQYNTPEEYEISCANQYYSIGNPQRSYLKHLPYMSVKKTRNIKNDGHILYAISEMSKYVYRIEFHAMSDSYLKYNLNWTKEVLKNLQPDIGIKMRMQSGQNSFNSLNKLKEIRPTMNIDDFSNSFDEELKNCKLYITNNIATTFLESMTLNKPTIVMISKNVYLFREISQPFMDMLEECKILHYSYESVISHINKNYNNINEWWLCEETQNSRIRFLDMFMKDDESWINSWIREFDKNLNIEREM